MRAPSRTSLVRMPSPAAAPARPTAAAPQAPTAQATPARPAGPAGATRAAAAAAIPVLPTAPGAVFLRFYEAFVARDFDTMERLYAPDVKFADMVFRYDDHAGTMGMWRTILRDPSTKIRFALDGVDGDHVRGRWVADYEVFGRKVHNELTTEMTVKDGRIVRHVDDSDWDTWAPQALPLGSFSTLPVVRDVLRFALRHFVDARARANEA